LALPCEHPFCRTCLQRYLVGKTKSHTKCFPILCPEQGCGREITVAAAERVLSHTEMERYRTKRTEDLLYCPKKTCSHLMSLDSPKAKELKRAACPKCKTAICVPCKAHDHPGKSCEQAQVHGHKDTLEDKSVLNLAKLRSWCRCPACQVMVELAHGCNHITCPCGSEL
ncbi:hypothetical protein THASP1DRAFT_20461, partial [Thamnocephalis sphaerospora]